jgi:Mrp family chromosome partitioning ATPase
MNVALPTSTSNRSVTTERIKQNVQTMSTSNSDLDMLLWRLRTRIQCDSTAAILVGLTSCSAKSGVTTLTTNLSIRAASNHMGPVLLIDANMGAPRLHKIFKITPRSGLFDLLSGSNTPEEAIHPTAIDSLDLMPFGSRESIRSGKIGPGNYSDIISWIRDRYRTVFIDLPTIDSMRHSLFLARKFDTTIVAVRSESVRRSDAATAIRRMTDDGVNIGGTILTRRFVYTPWWLRHA